ncbi:MAG: HutD family protein [Pseudomonadota bacterium]
MNVKTLPAGLRRFSVTELAAEPWRNGGGQTRQIAARPQADGDGWDWRVSLADIQCDGPFSAFTGIDRQAVLAEGRQLTLRDPEGTMHFAHVGDRHAFDGALALSAELAEGPARLFNVMTRRGRARAAVSVHQGKASLTMASQSASLVLLVASGEFLLHFCRPDSPAEIGLGLSRGEGLHIEGLQGRLDIEALSLDACLLAAQLDYLA